ncbi:MAG TPA: hypothetical protein VN661_02225 [Candidatus Acidoferrales bacterium]|nr:hypothetical protein [Candidatus Acidoferrales bacterium]
MELGETVNAAPAEWRSTSVFSIPSAGPDRSGAALPAPTPMPRMPVAAKSADQGPCLYLGPAGERCEQRALKGGFCRRHQPGAPRFIIGDANPPLTSKRVAAIVAIIGALWPILMDFLHALAKFFR